MKLRRKLLDLQTSDPTFFLILRPIVTFRKQGVATSKNAIYNGLLLRPIFSSRAKAKVSQIFSISVEQVKHDDGAFVLDPHKVESLIRWRSFLGIAFFSDEFCPIDVTLYWYHAVFVLLSVKHNRNQRFHSRVNVNLIQQSLSIIYDPSDDLLQSYSIKCVTGFISKLWRLRNISLPIYP